MTSNAVNEQHTRGWKELPPMPQGARYGNGCELDEHRMIILGGEDDRNNALSSGFVYDARTKQSTHLPNDIPEARYWFSAVANEQYMYVIGGRDADYRLLNTMFRLSLDTYEWTTMAPMGTARAACAAVLLGDYVYIFGGSDDNHIDLASVERYSIVGNTWEDLPDMAVTRWGHCAVAALRNRIYILGDCTRVVEVFDIALLEWRTEANLCDMPESIIRAAALVLRNRYLVVIGGEDEDYGSSAGCLIYDCSINQWNSTPASMNMITARLGHTAGVLDGKIFVTGGCNGDGFNLSSVECIDVRNVLEYAPLDYPLPDEYFNQILQLGKALLITNHT